MELLHLRYFVAVAEELNFSAAARKLHMAASPLSQRVKDLEHELGEKLFDRSTHHVTLTAAGTALLPLARDVLERINAIPWRLREAAEPQRSRVLLGMPAGVHPSLRERVHTLTELVREQFELKRWPGTSPELLDAVVDGRLALALVRMPVTDPALDALAVMSERLGAVVPADRFAGRESVKLAELAELAYVASPEESTPAYFEQLDHQLTSLGIKRRIKLSRSDYSAVSELVSSGLAFTISMLDDASPMHQYRLENVAVLPFDDFRPELDTNLVWRRDRGEAGDLTGLVVAARGIFTEPLTS